jgi:hypothetical protein
MGSAALADNPPGSGQTAPGDQGVSALPETVNDGTLLRLFSSYRRLSNSTLAIFLETSCQVKWQPDEGFITGIKDAELIFRSINSGFMRIKFTSYEKLIDCP